MESALFAALAVGALWATLARRPWWLGVLVALALLTRIEGLALLGPALVLVVFGRERRLAPAFLVPLVVLAAFVAWNYARLGSPLPSTMASKRFAHGVGRTDLWTDLGLFVDWGRYIRFGLGRAAELPGVGWLLLPLSGLGIWSIARRSRGWDALWVLLVLVGYNVAYVLLLPAQGGGRALPGAQLVAPRAAASGRNRRARGAAAPALPAPPARRRRPSPGRTLPDLEPARGRLVAQRLPRPRPADPRRPRSSGPLPRPDEHRLPAGARLRHRRHRLPPRHTGLHAASGRPGGPRGAGAPARVAGRLRHPALGGEGRRRRAPFPPHAARRRARGALRSACAGPARGSSIPPRPSTSRRSPAWRRAGTLPTAGSWPATRRAWRCGGYAPTDIPPHDCYPARTTHTRQEGDHVPHCARARVPARRDRLHGDPRRRVRRRRRHGCGRPAGGRGRRRSADARGRARRARRARRFDDAHRERGGSSPTAGTGR